jgi:hypothetical protein
MAVGHCSPGMVSLLPLASPPVRLCQPLVCGIDISEDMLTMSRKRCADQVRVAAIKTTLHAATWR